MYNYTYNADGIRTRKTVYDANGDYVGATEYIYDGTKLIAENRSGTWLYYFYDASGAISGMSYNGTLYYFRKNLQGDVTGIYNAYGTLVVEYEYTPYGALLSTTGTMATTIGAINPIRYRGYYYDTDTGFYYLQTRYYDPEVGRFISADGYVSTGQGILGNNMFAYCLNNPIMFSDENGEMAGAIEAGVIGIGIALGIGIVASRGDIEDFVTGFFETLGDGLEIITDRITDYFSKRSRIKEEQEKLARERAYEKARLDRKMKETKEGWCIIVAIYEKNAVVFRGPIKIREAIEGIQIDLLAGTNEYIPPNCQDWGIYTPSQKDAYSCALRIFGTVYLETDPRADLPHYHSSPKYFYHAGKKINFHGWFMLPIVE